MRARRKYYQTKTISKRTKPLKEVDSPNSYFLLTLNIKRVTKFAFDVVMLTGDQIKTGKMFVKKNI